jgi:hypothetical protein
LHRVSASECSGRASAPRASICGTQRC